MKSTGIVRCIDDLGRVVVPKELRRTLDIAEGDPIEFFVDDNNIVLRKYQPGCRFCGSIDDLTNVSDVLICHDCATSLARNYLEP